MRALQTGLHTRAMLGAGERRRPWDSARAFWHTLSHTQTRTHAHGMCSPLKLYYAALLSAVKACSRG